MNLYWPPLTSYPHHCSGCRCFTSTFWTQTITNPYVPRHRKPGPAH